MRKKRVIQAGKCYHLVSRVAHRAYFLDDEEKDRFVDLLRRVEFFCCVKVLAYCCMPNHIHVFIFLDHPRALSGDDILARVNALYRGARLAEALGEKETRLRTTRHLRPERRSCSGTLACYPQGGSMSSWLWRRLSSVHPISG